MGVFYQQQYFCHNSSRRPDLLQNFLEESTFSLSPSELRVQGLGAWGLRVRGLSASGLRAWGVEDTTHWQIRKLMLYRNWSTNFEEIFGRNKISTKNWLAFRHARSYQGEGSAKRPDKPFLQFHRLLPSFLRAVLMSTYVRVHTYLPNPTFLRLILHTFVQAAAEI